jgi:hypothetical protein
MNQLASRRQPAQESITAVLTDAVRADPLLRRKMGAAVSQGQLCVIRDAFDRELAEGVARLLEEDGGWQRAATLDQTFSHHVLADPARYRGQLLRCHQIFASPATRTFMTRLCGVDCGGPTQFGASLYLPGDYVLPHSDHDSTRSVAFVWCLTRDWDARWGGHLFWCATGTHVKPTFNTLVLFRVSRETMHLVCPVSPFARSRGLTIDGWWTRSRPAAARAPLPPGERALAPGVFVF